MEGSYQAEVKEITCGWWLLLLVGLLSIVVGVIFLFKPGNSLAALAVIAGIFLLIDGIAELASSFYAQHPQPRHCRPIRGARGDRRGAIDPPPDRRRHRGRIADRTLAGAAIGVIRFATAFEEYQHRGWHALAGALELIAGIVIVANSNIGYATLAILVGIGFILNGIGLTVLGWGMRDVRKEVSRAG